MVAERGGRSDADLVTAHLAGDASAFADLYDRYSDRLHDYCFSVLRDHHAAADALQDTMVTASQRLGGLRDPSKLRPWLYAVARHECYRRIRARDREAPVEDVAAVSGARFVDLDTTAGGDAGGAGSSEIAAIVWEAAAGLEPRDRAVLDLAVRHGLDGEALAAALGVPTTTSYSLVSRVRSRVERSLGALLVARKHRTDCPELTALTVGWDGTLTPLVRKRIARHIDGCTTCGEHRKRVVSPAALLRATPLVVAPAGAKAAAFERISSISPHDGGGDAAEPWGDDGFPPSESDLVDPTDDGDTDDGDTDDGDTDDGASDGDTDDGGGAARSTIRPTDPTVPIVTGIPVPRTVRIERSEYPMSNAQRRRRRRIAQRIVTIVLLLVIAGGAIVAFDPFAEDDAATDTGGKALPVAPGATLPGGGTLPPATPPATVLGGPPAPPTSVGTTPNGGTVIVTLPPPLPSSSSSSSSSSTATTAPYDNVPPTVRVVTQGTNVLYEDGGCGGPETQVVEVDAEDNVGVTDVTIAWTVGSASGSAPMAISQSTWQATVGPWAPGTVPMGGEELVDFTITVRDALGNLTNLTTDSLVLLRSCVPIG